MEAKPKSARMEVKEVPITAKKEETSTLKT